MTNNYLKRYSTSLALRQIQNHNVSTFYNHWYGNKKVEVLGCGEIRTIIHSWWECAAAMGNSLVKQSEKQLLNSQA